MEIKATCKYDFDAVKALTHLTMYKKADPKKRLVFWSVAFLILCLIIVVEMLVFGMDSFLFLLLGIEILGMALIYFWYFVIPKIQFKTLAKMQYVENQYTFCDHVLKTVTKSQVYNSQAEIEYALFVKAFETSKYLFLYQTNNQAFIVDKNTIQGGTIEDLRKQLSVFLKDKYVLCNY